AGLWRPCRLRRADDRGRRLRALAIDAPCLCRQVRAERRGTRGAARNGRSAPDPRGAPRQPHHPGRDHGGDLDEAADAAAPIRQAGPAVMSARPQLDGEIRNGRHVMPVRVYYEDTDFSGIVYHANYLRFMERGRSNYLRLLGADQRGLFEQAEQEAPGFAFVVRSMTIEFLKPARMDDVLDVVTTYEEVKGASIMLQQRILRGDELLIEAHVRVAFVCDGRAQPIPKPLRQAMTTQYEEFRSHRPS